MIQSSSKKILVLAYGVPGITAEQLRYPLELTQKNLNWLKSHGIINYSGNENQFLMNHSYDFK